MTLKECYEQLGGNYEDTLQRLCSDKLVTRFLIKFMDDTNYEKLTAAIEAKDGEAAFAAAHTLKGVALNLGLTALATPVNELTETLRHGWDDNATCLLPPVIAAYERTVAAIQAWQAEAE